MPKTTLSRVSTTKPPGASSQGKTIPPRDLLHGTFLRVDKKGSGAVSHKDLARIFKELRVKLNDREVQELITWYDTNGTNTLPYAALVEDAFPRNMTFKSKSLPALTSGQHSSRSNAGSQPPTPASAMSTSRKKMMKINAEKHTIERRLRQHQEQQKAQAY